MRRWKLGVNITLDPKQADADCALAAKLGARIVRTSQEQGWGDVQTRLGPFRKACDEHGLELFQTCQPIGHVVPRTQAGLDAWGTFVAECAAISDRTSGGNEVNGFGSNEPPDPQGQAEMMLAAIDACVTTPGARLTTPAMQPGSGPSEPFAFLVAMNLAQPSMLRDVSEVDWHGYCDARYPATTTERWNTCYETRAVHAWLATLGYARKRICWSEFGTPTGPPGYYKAVDLKTQALRFDQYLIEAGLQETQAGVRHGELIWYRLMDSKPASETDWPSCCGLFDIHGEPKPIAARFKVAAAASL